jgi:DNA-binding response OmpR family regulator
MSPRGATRDRVAGLKGADDTSRPDLEELVARVHAHLRRRSIDRWSDPEGTLTVATSCCCRGPACESGRMALDLTAREFTCGPAHEPDRIH